MAEEKFEERAHVRRLLEVLLASDADLNAFCIDYFPIVYRRFSDSMDRTQKENLLLVLVSPESIVQALRRVSETPELLASGLLPAAQSHLPLERTTVSVADLQPPRAPYNPRWYVRRSKQEQRARDALIYRQPVVLYGPELYGKTWLLQSIIEEVRQSDRQVTSINLGLFGNTALTTLDGFLRKLALRLCKELRLATDEIEATFDSALNRGGPLDALYDIMEWHILPATPKGFVLALDNVDLIAEKSYQDEFFGMLRAWTDNSENPFDRLRLILGISTAPTLLVKDANRSPFNIGDELVVEDLEDEQIHSMAAQHGVSLSAQLLEQLRSLVGGHPYLLRTLLYESRRQAVEIPRLLSQAEDTGGVFSSYLAHLRRKLIQTPELLAAIAQVDCDGRSAVTGPVRQRLERGGLVLKDGTIKGLRLRHRLYRKLLDHE